MAKSPKTPRPRRASVKASLQPLQPFVDPGADVPELAKRLRTQAKSVRNPDSDNDDSSEDADDSLDQEAHALARKRFASAMEFSGPWLTQAAIDQKWAAGTNGDQSYQWPVVVQQQRDMEQRPFETINRLPSFIKQITNQQRQAGPSMQVVPLKGAKSHSAAEAREGLLRHTMLISEGEVQVDTIFEDMATVGKGWAEAVNRYEAEDDDTTDDQEIYVEWRDPFTVFIDPAAVKLDKADMRFAFVPYDLPIEEYNLLYPESVVAKQGEMAWHGLEPTDRQRWFPTGCVRLARYYTVEEEPETETPKGGTRSIRRKFVRKRIINALETLDDVEMKRDGIALKRIPLVPMYGDRYLIDGKEDYRGMVRMARGPQRMLNFWITSLTEAIAFALKAPIVVGWSQMEGFQTHWDRLNSPNLKYLPYADKNADGSPANQNPPQRVQGEPANIQAITIAINIANESYQQVLSLYDPSLGKGKPDQSGAAIDSLKQQGEIGNSNYIDNAKRFYRSLGRLLLQMYPVYYDSARVRRIIGTDGSAKTLVFHSGEDNAPDDEDLLDLTEETIGVESIFDLSVGKFDITVSTGPSFLSQRQQANADMLQLMKMAPQLLPMLIDKFLENSDIPGNTELAERAKRTISAIFQNTDANDPRQQLQKLQQTLQQFAQQHDLMMKELQAKTDFIKTEQVKYGAQVEMKKAELSAEERLQAMKNAASIAVAEINAQTKGVISKNEAAVELQALGMTHAHEAATADADRSHELGMAHVAGAQATAQADQAHEQALEEGAQPPPVDPNAAPPAAAASA